ncbi:anaerobic ribonucleoside reductase large subunit [Pectobacterium phage vB_PcaM_CBB]|uniref:Anaerobic NTP reductase large subunit n=1 Tax=Pectobacterium phage vB_PcaM_CBB TaxID=2772511 RepID=A0A1L2CUL6_9CAUD|nr:anaerobic ribonucleoside reductase large subunit [Pectobacterium phage vB_PcaM_CBB]AMM43706.1 anaerobic NTP reductase large subunit [Pectobacterium phage vB_PcaM_CBB]
MNSDRLYSDINQFLNQSNKDLLNENANKDAKIVNTHRDLLAGILSKHFAEDIISEDLMQWHKNGYGHIHDLDYFISPLTNCCLVNYRDMLENGFKIGNAQVGTPNSIGVASTVLTQIVLAVSASQYGGQTLAHIDFGLEPYVQKSYNKLLEQQKEFDLPDEYVEKTLQKEVYDAMQALLYQVNTITSSNGQTPFVTITMGLNTSKFGKMITDSYLKVHEKGLGVDGTTPVFPKVVFFLEDGVNMKEEDPNYDLKVQAMRTSAKRIYPDFVSVPLNKKVTGSTSIAVSPMGCRSFLGKWEDDGIEKYDGRFNLGVVSINLPLLALESKSDGEFFGKLDYHMSMAYRAQMNRVERLKNMKARQNPTMFMEGAIARLKADDTIEGLFYDGYASISIGYVGLAECSEIMLGQLSKDYCKSILHYMKYKCEQFKEESNIAFSLYGTPAESLCYKFARAIEEKHPNILKRDFITNSFHQPVWVESSQFKKFDYEESFAYLSNGGNISYVETPNLSNNLKALETLIDYAYDRIPYFGINQPVDKCYKCDFEGEFAVDKIGFHCPQCDNREEGTMSVIRRVSGYLSAPNSRPFNTGKQQEVIQRIKHEEEKDTTKREND